MFVGKLTNIIMWIALSIIGLYYWLLKRRKRKTKQGVSNLLSVFVLLVTLTGTGKAQNGEIIISGEIITTIQNKGKIIVFLVDETAFKKPLNGIDTVIVSPTAKVVQFKFKLKEKGVYGIRCFHDLNNNGILDKKGFFPSEPYGFSWKSRKKFPFGFSDISFTANTNKFITIKMED